MKNLLLLLFPLSLHAQNVSIGGWKDYLSYNSASYIAEANEMIYCVANGGLFYIQKKDNSINRISKITGLSDVDIKQIAYCHELNTTIIAYNNCNIDLLTNNTIVNISDIKRKEILGNKTIRNITIKSPYAYISSSFGLIVLNLERQEISDTYNIGDGINLYEINGCAIKGDSILCATSEGVFMQMLILKTCLIITAGMFFLGMKIKKPMTILSVEKIILFMGIIPLKQQALAIIMDIF